MNQVHPVRPFANSSRQDQTVEMGLRSIQKVPSGNQDRRNQSYPSMSQAELKTCAEMGSHAQVQEQWQNRSLWVPSMPFPFQRTVNTEFSHYASRILS